MFITFIPNPGALALLGLPGLAPRCRNKNYGKLGGSAVMATPPLLATEPKGVSFHVSIFQHCFFFSFRDRDRSEFGPDGPPSLLRGDLYRDGRQPLGLFGPRR